MKRLRNGGGGRSKDAKRIESRFIEIKKPFFKIISPFHESLPFFSVGVHWKSLGN